MKKLTNLLMALILLLSCVLTACTGSETDPTPDKPIVSDESVEPNTSDESDVSDVSDVSDESEDTSVPDRKNPRFFVEPKIAVDYDYPYKDDYEITLQKGYKQGFEFGLIEIHLEQYGIWTLRCDQSEIYVSETCFWSVDNAGAYSFAVDLREAEYIKEYTVDLTEGSNNDVTLYVAFKVPETEAPYTFGVYQYYIPENEDNFDLYNIRAPRYIFGYGNKKTLRTHDYCYCGTAEYVSFDWVYRITVEDGFDDGTFLKKYGYITDYNYDEKFKALNDEYNAAYAKAMENRATDGWTLAPYTYYAIRYFDVKKEDFLDYREKEFEKYLSDPSDGYFNAIKIFTEREIEVLFGDYSYETVLKVLKNDATYYYKGGLYTSDDIKKLDDEKFWEMMQEDDFMLYLFDLQNLHLGDFTERVERLRAENGDK